MKLKNKRNIREAIVILMVMILMLFIAKVSVTAAWYQGYTDNIDWNSGTTGDTKIWPQLHTSNGPAGSSSTSDSVSKRVSELRVGQAFWITGYGRAKDNQISRAPSVLCSERGNNITTKQQKTGKRVQYKVTAVHRISTYDNHTLADKGLAYIVSFKRNDGQNFDKVLTYHPDNVDPIQNAFWTFSYTHQNEITVLPRPIGKTGDKVNGSEKIVKKAEDYMRYVETGVPQKANIKLENPKWNQDYSKLYITYNLDYKTVENFGKVKKLKVSYKNKNENIVSKEYTDINYLTNGNHTIEILEKDVTDKGCDIRVEAEYEYTLVDSTIIQFEDVNKSTHGQNLVIVSGKRWTETTNTTASNKIPTKVTDVSMQKYITKVIDGDGVEQEYFGRKNKYATNEAGFANGYIHSGKISSNPPEENNSTDSNSWKKTNNILIEAGDTVEYTIEVYNNSRVPATITLKDEMINTAEITKVIKDGVEIQVNYPGKNEKEPTNYRNGDLCTFNLGGFQKTTFKIYVYYGIYNTEYSRDSKPPIMNKAWINTNPKNITIYRTVDADYIKMKEYKVSLEKWVSNKNKTSTPVDNLISKKYANVIEYIRNKNNKETILNDLQEKAGNIEKEEYLKYIINDNTIYEWNLAEYTENLKKTDLNKDGKVNLEDLNYFRAYEVYKKLGTEAQSIINKYINADLNNDFKVTNEDFNIYKVLKANLYKGLEIDNNQSIQDLNNKDIYMFILKEINQNNVFNVDGLEYLKLKRLLSNKTKEELKAEIENYIKSDINDDGIVDQNDNYSFNENKTQVIIRNIQKEIIDGEEREIIYESQYDLLLSKTQVDNIDIKELQKNQEGQYNLIEQYDLNKDHYINQIDIDLLEKNNNGTYDKIKNSNEDNLLQLIKTNLVIENTSPDFDSYFDYNGDQKINIDDINAVEDEIYIQNLIDKLIIDNQNLDFNADGKLSYADYELVEEYEKFKDKINGMTKEKIEEIILKYNIYDEGLSQIKLSKLEELIKNNGYISGGGDDGWYDMEFAEYAEFDLNKDKIIDSKDIELAKEQILNEGNSDENGFDEKDIYVIKLYKGVKQYNANINMQVDLYDLNGDKKITIADIERIDNIKDININYDIADINEFITFFDELLKEVDENKNNLQRLDTDINDSNADENNNVGDKADYDLLNKIINDKLKEIPNYKDILKNEESYKDITKSNYNYYDANNGIIKYTAEEYYSYLDVNSDGSIDEKDTEFLKTYESMKLTTEINANIINTIKDLIKKDINEDGAFSVEDITIVENIKIIEKQNYDLNQDNTYNIKDLELYKEAKRLTDKDKQSILDYLEKGEESGSSQDYADRKGHAEYLTRVNGKLIDNTDNDTKWTQHNDDKLNNVVTVKKGDIVTYTIKVKNDGDTNVYISSIKDILPNGVMYKGASINGYKDTENNNTYIFSGLKDILLMPGNEASFTIDVIVTKSNMSIDLLKNTAKITQIKNKYNKDVQDSTPYNNEDSDYIQLKDIVIQGNVWNDRATDKEQNDYNGYYEENKDINLQGIKVKLYRVGTGVVEETLTDDNGNYKFDFDYIKASKIESNNSYLTNPDYERRWETYYSYYIVFEYDGITYTSTFDKNGNRIWNISQNTNNKMYSNAAEDNGQVKETREKFNNKFSTINKDSGISYTTKNEKDYMPQSNHVYNSDMAMQSSTNLITLSNNANLEEQLQHVNLGLRGRDIFDLELISDVSKITARVNGQTGVYTDTNKVTIRNSDFPKTEDMANKVNEAVEDNVNEYYQDIRNTDLDVGKAESNYKDEQELDFMEVTYKITVTNASQTAGTATIITDYYDKCYSKPRAYIGNDEGDKIADIIGGTDFNNYNEKYNKVEITLPENYLTQSASNYLYITFNMDVNKLKDSFNANNKKLEYKTFNMAEITEYKTKCAEGQTEYTRGLLDKDSAPGSVEREQVRTTKTVGKNTPTINGNPTTIKYYFEGKDLSELKYEDDTYATPTLYFTSSDNGRKITGTVFEDYTKIYDGGIKSGNGIKDLATSEPGIKGATVQLIEIVNEKPILRYQEKTNADGYYEFNNFLPGNYIIKYYYGETNETFIVNDINSKSYNGEDFQSTNNTGNLIGTNKLSDDDANCWYAYNEGKGVSTAIDDKDRRDEVSENVIGFTDLQMEVLNKARDGKEVSEVTTKGKEVDSEGKWTDVEYTAEDIEKVTSMRATTKNMLLTMEETVLTEGKPEENKEFTDYIISNMNFGIAEVPVTTIDLQKTIKSFTIRDSADQNDIAKITKDDKNYSVAIRPLEITKDKKQRVINGLVDKLNISKEEAQNAVTSKNEVVPIGDNYKKNDIADLENYLTANSITRGVIITHGWKVEAGDVYAPTGIKKITAQIQDEKLQGAKLQITYEITASMSTEKNFDNTEVRVPSIKGVIDYIDNDLSYNEELGDNKKYWEVTTYENALETYNNAAYECIKNGKTVKVIPKGTLDPEGKKYTTIVKAKAGNPLLLKDVGTSEPVEITLEKVLSSNDTSIMDIITSNVDTYEYENNIEITGLDYKNTETNGKAYRDRIRTPERYILLAGSQHDSFSAETLSIFPPTGENRSMQVYIIAVISLGILALGAYGIRRFVIKRK